MKSAVAIPTNSISFRESLRLVLPKEHGSWSLALEPIALGLLVAPSEAGSGLALAAVAGFFLRRPLKLVFTNPSDPRRSQAIAITSVLLTLAAGGLLLTWHVSSLEKLWPLLPAAILGLGFAWFDARGENRFGAAEVCGAATFACLPATFATLADWPFANAAALSAVMLARSVPTVLFVRTMLRRAKGQTIHLAPVLWLTSLATVTLAWLANQTLLPWLPVIMSGVLFIRTIALLTMKRPRLSARKLGVLELILGLLVVLTAVLAWHF